MEDVVLTKTLSRTTGQVNVQGPLADKILSLGLLETAKNLVHNYVAPAAGAPKFFIPANGQLPVGMKPPGGG